MIGAHFAFDTASVVGRFAMKKLIAVVVAQGDHVFHPKMVGEGTDLARGLFEAVFDLEAQAIETDDVDRAQRRIGAHQDARAPCGMHDDHKTHEPPGRCRLRQAGLAVATPTCRWNGSSSDARPRTMSSAAIWSDASPCQR